MENASKALIIAGAILVAILLIGIGVGLINAANSTIGGATDQMDEQAIKIFNAKFEGYAGKQKGSNIKSLISAVITANANADNSGRTTISVKWGSYTTTTDIMNKIVASKTYTVSLGYTNGYVTSVTIT